MGGEGRESKGRQSSPSVKGCGAVSMEGIGLEEEMRPKGVVKTLTALFCSSWDCLVLIHVQVAPHSPGKDPRAHRHPPAGRVTCKVELHNITKQC